MPKNGLYLATFCLLYTCLELAATTFVQDTPFFAAPIQNTTVRLGDTARLVCIVENLGPYQVAWVHQASGAVLTVGDRVVTGNSRVTVTREQRNTWVLGINNVTRKDVGQYMCQVSTSPPRKLYGHLFIVEPPIFEWHSQIARVREGQTAILECHARGIPHPKILWKREDDEYIRMNTSVKVESYQGSKLILFDSSPKTSGTFICVASNGHPPSVSRMLTLKVIHSPRVEFISDKRVVWATRGSTVSLSCRYSAYPLPRVVFHLENFQRTHNWSHSLFEIKSLKHQYPYTHIMTLTIPSITSFDFGNHSCIVTNEEGQDYDWILVRERITTTSSSTSTTSRPTTLPNIEGGGPIPLRDGSFSSPEANLTVPLFVKPPPTQQNPNDRKRKKHTNSTTENRSSSKNQWSKKIARINLSEHSHNYASRTIQKDWNVVLIILLTKHLVFDV